MSKLAPKNTEQAAQFIKDASNGPLKWEKLCLSLQRQARDLPVVYPSALSAALATPVGERVTRVEDLRRGMIAYCDDPRDSNPFAHVFFIAGRNKDGRVITGTNDAIRTGGVDYVYLDWYERNWGDKFMFGATWLNGYDFSEFDEPPVETRGGLGANYVHAIEDVKKAERYHRKRGHTIIADKLLADIKRMERRLERYVKNANK